MIGFLKKIIYIAQPREEITVIMPDGSERKAKSWETSPMDVAKEVSKSLSERIVIAKVRPSYSKTLSILFFFKCTFLKNSIKVDDELWDLERPLEKSCKLELLDFEHPEGKKEIADVFSSFLVVGFFNTI